MTVLCTDKTGTLTEGTIVLADATDPKGRTSAAVRQLAFLNAAFETGIDNPIDAAIVTAGNRRGSRPPATPRSTRSPTTS